MAQSNKCNKKDYGNSPKIVTLDNMKGTQLLNGFIFSTLPHGHENL